MTTVLQELATAETDPRRGRGGGNNMFIFHRTREVLTVDKKEELLRSRFDGLGIEFRTVQVQGEIVFQISDADLARLQAIAELKIERVRDMTPEQTQKVNERARQILESGGPTPLPTRANPQRDTAEPVRDTRPEPSSDQRGRETPASEPAARVNRTLPKPEVSIIEGNSGFVGDKVRIKASIPDGRGRFKEVQVEFTRQPDGSFVGPNGTEAEIRDHKAALEQVFPEAASNTYPDNGRLNLMSADAAEVRAYAENPTNRPAAGTGQGTPKPNESATPPTASGPEKIEFWEEVEASASKKRVVRLPVDDLIEANKKMKELRELGIESSVVKRDGRLLIQVERASAFEFVAELETLRAHRATLDQVLSPGADVSAPNASPNQSLAGPGAEKPKLTREQALADLGFKPDANPAPVEVRQAALNAKYRLEMQLESLDATKGVQPIESAEALGVTISKEEVTRFIEMKREVQERRQNIENPKPEVKPAPETPRKPAMSREDAEAMLGIGRDDSPEVKRQKVVEYAQNNGISFTDGLNLRFNALLETAQIAGVSSPNGGVFSALDFAYETERFVQGASGPAAPQSSPAAPGPDKTKMTPQEAREFLGKFKPSVVPVTDGERIYFPSELEAKDFRRAQQAVRSLATEAGIDLGRGIFSVDSSGQMYIRKDAAAQILESGGPELRSALGIVEAPGQRQGKPQQNQSGPTPEPMDAPAPRESGQKPNTEEVGPSRPPADTPSPARQQPGDTPPPLPQQRTGDTPPPLPVTEAPSTRLGRFLNMSGGDGRVSRIGGPTANGLGLLSQVTRGEWGNSTLEDVSNGMQLANGLVNVAQDVQTLRLMNAGGISQNGQRLFMGVGVLSGGSLVNNGLGAVDSFSRGDIAGGLMQTYQASSDGMNVLSGTLALAGDVAGATKWMTRGMVWAAPLQVYSIVSDTIEIVNTIKDTNRMVDEVAAVDARYLSGQRRSPNYIGPLNRDSVTESISIGEYAYASRAVQLLTDPSSPTRLSDSNGNPLALSVTNPAGLEEAFAKGRDATKDQIDEFLKTMSPRAKFAFGIMGLKSDMIYDRENGFKLSEEAFLRAKNNAQYDPEALRDLLKLEQLRDNLATFNNAIAVDLNGQGLNLSPGTPWTNLATAPKPFMNIKDRAEHLKTQQDKLDAQLAAKPGETERLDLLRTNIAEYEASPEFKAAQNLVAANKKAAEELQRAGVIIASLPDYEAGRATLDVTAGLRKQYPNYKTGEALDLDARAGFYFDTQPRQIAFQQRQVAEAIVELDAKNRAASERFAASIDSLVASGALTKEQADTFKAPRAPEEQKALDEIRTRLSSTSLSPDERAALENDGRAKQIALLVKEREVLAVQVAEVQTQTAGQVTPDQVTRLAEVQRATGSKPAYTPTGQAENAVELQAQLGRLSEAGKLTIDIHRGLDPEKKGAVVIDFKVDNKDPRALADLRDVLTKNGLSVSQNPRGEPGVISVSVSPELLAKNPALGQGTQELTSRVEAQYAPERRTTPSQPQALLLNLIATSVDARSITQSEVAQSPSGEGVVKTRKPIEGLGDYQVAVQTIGKNERDIGALLAQLGKDAKAAGLVVDKVAENPEAAKLFEKQLEAIDRPMPVIPKDASPAQILEIQASQIALLKEQRAAILDITSNGPTALGAETRAAKPKPDVGRIGSDFNAAGVLTAATTAAGGAKPEASTLSLEDVVSLAVNLLSGSLSNVDLTEAKAARMSATPAARGPSTGLSV